MAFVLELIKLDKNGKTVSSIDISQYVKHEGLKISVAKIQSANTRRTSSGNMNGTVVTHKYTLDINFVANPSPSKMGQINDLINSHVMFHKVKFTDIDGTTKTKKIYFGDIDYDMYHFINGKYMYNSISFKCIER